MPPQSALDSQQMEEELKNNPITNSHNGVVVDDEDDDTPTLSLETLAALKEFLAEQNGPPVNAEPEEKEKEKEVALMTEDWRLSQFWYDRDTAETVAHEVLTLSQPSQSQSDFRVACIACPTLYAYLKVFHSLSLSIGSVAFFLSLNFVFFFLLEIMF